MLGCWGAGSSQFQSPFSKLLSDPNVSLETILTDRNFNNMLRNEDNQLIDFLTREENILKMLKYTLTDDYVSKETDSKKILYLCLNVLTSESEKLVSKLSVSSVLLSAIANFKETEFAKQSVYCGYFSIIVESIAKATNGEVLGSSLSFLAPYLITNLHMMGLRQLFIRLVSNFGIPFLVSPKMMKYLVDQLTGRTQELYIALTIKDLLDIDPDICVLFESDEMFEVIIKEAVGNYIMSPILSSILLKAAFKIIQFCSNNNEAEGNITHHDFCKVKNLSLKYEEKIDFKNGPINCATAAALTIFPKNITFFIERFLKSELPTILNETILSIVNKMTIEELTSIAKLFHLPMIIIESFKNYKNTKVNGHFLVFTRVFAEKGICCCGQHKEKWKMFVVNKIAKQYRKSMMEYGGGINEESKNLQTDLFMSMDDLYSAALLLGEEEDKL